MATLFMGVSFYLISPEKPTGVAKLLGEVEAPKGKTKKALRNSSQGLINSPIILQSKG